MQISRDRKSLIDTSPEPQIDHTLPSLKLTPFPNLFNPLSGGELFEQSLFTQDGTSAALHIKLVYKCYFAGVKKTGFIFSQLRLLWWLLIRLMHLQ